MRSRGKHAHQDPWEHDQDDVKEAFGFHDLGVAEREFSIIHQEFTEDDVAPITNWVILNRNCTRMERTVWVFDVLVLLQTQCRLSPEELAWEMVTEGLSSQDFQKWIASYRQSRGRLRKKLLKKFAYDKELVRFTTLMFPEHENKKKARSPKLIT